jgi:hypothetical protein
MGKLRVNQIKPINNPLNIDGNLIVLGTVTADAYYGDGSNLSQTISEITLNGVDINSTTYLNYGINVITSGDVYNYVAKLPSTPIKGRTVNVVNNSGISMVLYPSMVGGSINGTVNGAVIIPSDSKSYTFTCYENPAPGAWSGQFIAAGLYDSGVITGYNILGSSSYIVGCDPVRWINTGTMNGAGGWALDGLNQPYFLNGILVDPYIAFKPTTPWTFMTRVRVYTNLTNYGAASFRITRGSCENYYVPGTNTFIEGGQQLAGDYLNISLNTLLSGTPVNVVSGLTANVGEPGTYYGELVFNSLSQPSYIGDNFISTGTYNLGPFNTPTLADLWITNYICCGLGLSINANGIKFRYLIDYV